MSRTPPLALVDGRPSRTIDADDRGLAYGDGLFETVLVTGGRVPLWSGHAGRLRRSCRRLRLRLPDPARLLAEIDRLAGGADCVVKLILSRCGGRGYAPVPGADTRRILLRYPAPTLRSEDYRQGLRLRWCRLALSEQPTLAGLKHLNRLEQVLARAEWRDPRIHEGLLCTATGQVVSATSANLFVVRSGRLLTPTLDRCGVAGVARDFLLRQARRQDLSVRETTLSRRDVELADELFLSNAVRGVMPVRALAGRRFAIGPVTKRLGYTLAALAIGLPPGIASE